MNDTNLLTLDTLTNAYPDTDILVNKNIHVSSDHKNIVILGLSTFNLRCTYSLTSYSYDENNYVQGYYQLEPVIKMLAKKLNPKNQGIDQIIVLASDKTLSTCDDKNNKYTITLKKGADEYSISNISALDFFVYSIKDWLNIGAEICAVCIPENKQEYFVEETKIDSIVLKKYFIEESDSKVAISKAMDILRTTRKNTSNIDLYVDTHGGLRGTQRSIDAIISLISNEERVDYSHNKINIAGVYSVEFSPKQRIIKDDGYEVFNFVTGINEFNNSGRFEFIRKYNENSSLVPIIEKITQGYQLCNILQYEEGINELSTFDWNSIKDPYLRLFADNIRNDYGDILTTTSYERTLLEMKWCLKKGFYQQLLTMVETKIPEMLYDCGGLYSLNKRKQKCAFSIRTKNGIIQKFNKLQEHVFPKDVSDNSTLSERIHYLVELDMPASSLVNLIKTNIKFEEDNREHRTITTIDHRKIEAYVIKKPTISYLCFNYPEFKDDQWKQFAMFLKIHFAFKTLRNNSNHLLELGKDIPLEKIKIAFNQYFEIIDQLNIFKI